MVCQQMERRTEPRRAGPLVYAHLDKWLIAALGCFEILSIHMSATEITSEIWQNRSKAKHGRATEGEGGFITHSVKTRGFARRAPMCNWCHSQEVLRSIWHRKQKSTGKLK